METFLIMHYFVFVLLIINVVTCACKTQSDEQVDTEDKSEEEDHSEYSLELKEFENMIAKKMEVLKNYLKTPADLLKIEQKYDNLLKKVLMK